MFPGLAIAFESSLEFASGRIHHQESHISPGSPTDHVGDKVFVSRGIQNVDNLRWSFETSFGHVHCDTTGPDAKKFSSFIFNLMKTYNVPIGRKFVIKIFALKNFKINIHMFQELSIFSIKKEFNTKQWSEQKKKKKK